MNQPRRRDSLLALVLAVVLVTGACGDDDDADSSGEARSTTTSTELTGAPLKLMVVYEGSAGLAEPALPEGAIAAAKAINANGGVTGRPIEVIPCDTKNDPNEAADCGRLAVSEGVVAMVGNFTVHSGEFAPLMEQNKIASIGLTPGTAPDFLSPAAFPVSGGAPVWFAALAGTLAEGGARSIAMARVDIDAGALQQEFANAGLQRFNTTLSKDVPVPPGAPDMSPYAVAALQDGTDAIVVGLPGQDAINFVQAARQARPDIKIALIATDIGAVLESLENDAEGIVLTESLTTALKNTAEQQYEEDMKAAGYDEFVGFRLDSYASVLVFREVAQDLPEITATAVFDALGQAEDVDVGLTPPLQFKTGGVGGLPRVFNACVFASQIKGGEQEPITGKFHDAYSGEECPTPL